MAQGMGTRGKSAQKRTRERIQLRRTRIRLRAKNVVEAYQ